MVIDPYYYPKSPGDKFFYKLDDWTDQEHARFTYGLLSGTKNHVATNSSKPSFASIINDPASVECKEFKMFSASIYAMSLVHMLAVDLNASLGVHFPGRIDGEVDDEEAEANYLASLARHEAIYDENARSIRDMHDAWVADREQAISKVKSALSRRKEAALEDNLRERLGRELAAAHRAKPFGTKVDIVKFVQSFILDHCPTVYTLAEVPKQAIQAASLKVKRKKGVDGEEADEEESYRRWSDQ